jgi:tripartite-type tricarboxylate transporter receptor subunit TctC
MRLWRTRIALIACAGSIGASFAPPAAAQGAYPAKPVRWIVPWPPGGGADVLSRMLSPKLAEVLKQQIVIDNRGGAAGNIGAELAAKSPPDGYTILFAYSGTHAINPSIYSRMPFKEGDFAPIIMLSSVPQVLVVHPSLPVKNVKELIALARKRPGQLTYGSSGSGAFNHLTGALFASAAKVNIVHVPYKGGGPAAVALLSGEITMILGEPASIVGFVNAGKVRALAVTGEKRALGMPELPTMAEAGVPGYAATSWNGMLAPAGVPAPVVKRLNDEFNRIIRDPEMRKRMLANGYEPVGGSPEQFGEHIRTEIAKWAPVVKATGVRVD